MAEEVGKLVKEVETLNDENGLLQGESVEETPEGEFGVQQDEQTSVNLNPLDDCNFYEHLTMSNKEVQMHFAELQEKFSSTEWTQNFTWTALSDELQDVRAAVLRWHIKGWKFSLVDESEERSRWPGKGGDTSAREEHSLSLSFSCVTDSPGNASLGESSFTKIF